MKIPICTIYFPLGNNSACGNHHFNIFMTCLVHLPIKAWSVVSTLQQETLGGEIRRFCTALLHPESVHFQLY